MKIAFITAVPITMFFYRDLLRHFIDKGHDVHALSSNLPELYQIQELGCKVFPVEISRKISPWTDLMAVLRLIGYFRRYKPHVVHAHTPKGGLIGMVASFLASVPHRIYTIHGCPLETAKGLKRKLLWFSDWLACRLATHVLVVSDSLRQLFLTLRVCPAEKMQILGNGTACGIDVERFCPTRQVTEQSRDFRQQWRIPADGVVFGYIGRLAPDKGIETLITSFTSLYEQQDNIRLLIVGTLDLSRERLSPTLLRQIENHPGIICTGYVTNTVPYYEAIDIVILASRREGFGLVLLEAAAMKKPSIATRVTGCIDAVVEGETGLLIDIDDTEQLLYAMKVLLEDPALRERMGIAGRKRVCELFSMKRLITEHVNFYESKCHNNP
ncbi:MAG: glycosyltransferase family 4 protein [Sedimentisphaerales bacterium]|nr:glycosyltransferase family 4 protein [Sedimentisphaerales bacterium]